jgi:hypothetical protein
MCPKIRISAFHPALSELRRLCSLPGLARTLSDVRVCGFTEATNPDGQEFGEVRLRDFMNAHGDLSAKQFAERLLREVLAWPGAANSHPQSDEITIVVIDIGTSREPLQDP